MEQEIKITAFWKRSFRTIKEYFGGSFHDLVQQAQIDINKLTSQIADQQALKEKAEKTVEGLRRLVQLVNDERDEYKTAYESSYERNMQANVAIGNVARERDDLQTENSRMKEDNAALQEQVTALQEERDHLLAANDEYQEKLRFEGEEER